MLGYTDKGASAPPLLITTILRSASADASRSRARNGIQYSVSKPISPMNGPHTSGAPSVVCSRSRCFQRGVGRRRRRVQARRQAGDRELGSSCRKRTAPCAPTIFGRADCPSRAGETRAKARALSSLPGSRWVLRDIRASDREALLKVKVTERSARVQIVPSAQQITASSYFPRHSTSSRTRQKAPMRCRRCRRRQQRAAARQAYPRS